MSSRVRETFDLKMTLTKAIRILIEISIHKDRFLNKIENHIRELYQKRSAVENIYHNILHTTEVVKVAAKIAEAETQENPVLKLKYAKSLRYFIDCLYEDCLNLESSKISGKDFVRMLRKELILLKRMHRSYVKSLL